MSTALLEAPAGIAIPNEIEIDEPGDPVSLYEIIDGIEVELPVMSMDSNYISNALGDAVTLFAHPRKLGQVYTEMLIHLNLPDDRDRNRRPDFIYVSYEKWPKRRRRPKAEAWNIVPDIAVEVISPTEIFTKVFEKVREYFEAGIPQVWIVDPALETAWVLDSRYKQRVLGPEDVLTSPTLLPGFELPLADLFAQDDEIAPTP